MRILRKTCIPLVFTSERKKNPFLDIKPSYAESAEYAQFKAKTMKTPEQKELFEGYRPLILHAPRQGWPGAK